MAYPFGGRIRWAQLRMRLSGIFRTVMWVTGAFVAGVFLNFLLPTVFYDLVGSRIEFWCVSVAQLIVLVLVVTRGNTFSKGVMYLAIIPISISSFAWAHGELVVRADLRIDLSSELNEPEINEVFSLGVSRLAGLLNNRDTSGIVVDDALIWLNEEPGFNFLRRTIDGRRAWTLRRVRAAPYEAALDFRPKARPIEVVVRFDTSDRPMTLVFDCFTLDSGRLEIAGIAARGVSSGISVWPKGSGFSNYYFYGFLRAYDTSPWAKAYIVFILTCSIFTIVGVVLRLAKGGAKGPETERPVGIL